MEFPLEMEPTIATYTKQLAQNALSFLILTTIAKAPVKKIARSIISIYTSAVRK